MIKSMLSGSVFVLLAALAAQAATLSGVVSTGGGRGASATPVADAKVVLMGFGGGGGAQQRLDSATTNAQGRYSFDSVGTGFRQVVVTKAGFETGMAFANVTQAGGEYTANVTLVATGGGGERGAVAGTVRATGTNGAPISGALVVLARPTGGAGGTMDSARTDAQGRYLFDSVAALSNYVVRVTATGYNPASNSNVDVDAGDTTVANFTLTPVPETPKPGSIAGTVRKQAGGEPLSGATVVLSRTGSSHRDTVKTGADGHYAFDSVAALTNWTVTVSLSGYQTAVNADVDVLANTTSTVDFGLIASGPIVNRGSIIGTVTGPDKKAVAKARVILSRAGTVGGSGSIDTVETDASGDYAFDSVAALQNFTVTVQASGFQNAVNTNVDVIAGQAVVADFVLVVSSVSLRPLAGAGSDFRVAPSRGSLLSLSLPPSPWAGRLSAYDARGALALSLAVPAGATRLDLPVRSGMRVLVLERGGMVERLALPDAR